MRVFRSLGLLALFAAIALAGLPSGPARADIETWMGLGMDMPGGDLGSYPLTSPDPGFCRLSCDQNPQCRGWVFAKPGVLGANAVCILKSQVSGSGVQNANAIAGIKNNETAPYPGAARVEADMMLGVDLPGGDIASFRITTANPQLCAQSCAGRSDCRSWTMIKPGPQGPQAICFLKGVVPNGVVNNNTISGLRPGGGVGGPGGAGGPGAEAWGVWAYRSYGSNWADPCSIAYVASPVSNPRYAGNPGSYVLVRTRDTQRDADLDINAFSFFFQNQPDGVVKMVACDKNAPFSGGGQGGGGNQYAAWMTGTFDSSGGLMTLSPGGGRYADRGGQLQVTRIQGNVMEGIWTQTESGGQCADGRYYGKFRFEFREDGFTGTYGYCDKEPTQGGFSGKRRK